MLKFSATKLTSNLKTDFIWTSVAWKQTRNQWYELWGNGRIWEESNV